MDQTVKIAGFSGSKLWSLSRSVHPKKFLVINGKDAMLQAKMKRLNKESLK